MPLKIFYPSASRVVVVYDNYMALYDAQEGSELARFDYGGLPVQSASMGSSGNIALLFGDGEHSAQTRVVLFDSGLNVTGQASVGARTFSVTAGRREAYVLAAGGVYCYGPDGTLWGTRQTENRPLAVVAAKKTVLLTAASASELQFAAPQESGAAGRRAGRALQRAARFGAQRKRLSRAARAPAKSFGKGQDIMEFSPAILLDVALVGVVVFTVAYYMRRGFLAGLLGLVGNLASLALAWFLSGRVSPTLFENFFKSGLIDQTARLISEQGAAGVQAILDKFSAFLPASLLESITQQADSIFNSGAPDMALAIVENVVAPLVMPLIGVVVFFAVFVLGRVVISLLAAIFSNVNRVPLVGSVNRGLGAVIGLVAGLINVLMVLCIIWAVVVITGGSLPGLNDQALAGSRLYTFFSAYNPFS